MVVQRVNGPVATELFLLGQPGAESLGAGTQAEVIYRAIARILVAAGGGFQSLVTETVFLRNLDADIGAVRAARQKVLGTSGTVDPRPAMTEIEQPPLDPHACLQVLVHAVLPRQAAWRKETIHARPACACAECARMHGLRIQVADEVRFHAGGIFGTGAEAYAQALSMFELAEALLQEAGLEFSDVARTWIHLRDIDRDYPALNRARRTFFAARGIDPAPASTGIGAGPAMAAHDLCLGLYAFRAGRGSCRNVMTSPTLNEAMEYGADFVRGMRIEEANKVALHVSGTASIDADGRTLHVNDFAGQAKRTLVNIAALLNKQGASFRDVVSAVTYLKRPDDADHLRGILSDAGFDGFPNAMVVAPVCRPELLCEIEVLAALPEKLAP